MPFGKTELEPHETWDVQDSTKLVCIQTCSRQYFFNYILGWRSTRPSIHLIFGQALHYSMEHLMLTMKEHSYDINALPAAFDLFLKCFREQFPPERDNEHKAKTPENALLALTEYIEQYPKEEFEVVDTEIAGTVLIAIDKALSFKMDTVIATARGYGSLEHKTGSEVSNRWRMQFKLGIQTGTYNHVLNMLYGIDNTVGTMINGIILRMKGNAFVRVPTQRTREMMNDWLYTIIYLWEHMKWCLDELHECSPDDQILKSFPKDTTACTKYDGCPFIDYCLTMPNPLRYAKTPPDGFKIEYWDPRKCEEDAKRVEHIEEVPAI